MRVVYGVLVLTLLANVSRAQSAREFADRGLAAYAQLDFAAAAGLLRLALAGGGEAELDPETHARVLTTLGAAEVFRGNADSALSAFRRLVIAFPRYELDELIFPPEITGIFSRVRRTTPVVELVPPPDEVRVVIGEGAYEIDVYPSTTHQISATIERGDGRIVQTLFAGPVGDRLTLRWDGRDTTGALLRSGPYVVRVRSGANAGLWERVAQLPLDVQVTLADTLEYPGAVPDSLLRPERLGGEPSVRALVGGLAAGLTIAVVPSIASSDLNASRFAVAGAVSVAGVIGFFTQRPGTPIPANIEYNTQVFAAWQDSVRVIRDLNASRRRASEIRIRAGTPTSAEIRP